jgi:hypothetical protein
VLEEAVQLLLGTLLLCVSLLLLVTNPPPPSRTKWTRLVHPSVLIGHVSARLQVARLGKWLRTYVSAEGALPAPPRVLPRALWAQRQP